jgi:hypothetical protein
MHVALRKTHTSRQSFSTTVNPTEHKHQKNGSVSFDLARNETIIVPCKTESTWNSWLNHDTDFEEFDQEYGLGWEEIALFTDIENTCCNANDTTQCTHVDMEGGGCIVVELLNGLDNKKEDPIVRRACARKRGYDHQPRQTSSKRECFGNRVVTLSAETASNVARLPLSDITGLTPSPPFQVEREVA